MAILMIPKNDKYAVRKYTNLLDKEITDPLVVQIYEHVTACWAVASEEK